MTGVTAAQSLKIGRGDEVFGRANEGEGLGPGAGLGASGRSCCCEIGILAMTGKVQDRRCPRSTKINVDGKDGRQDCLSLAEEGGERPLSS